MDRTACIAPRDRTTPARAARGLGVRADDLAAAEAIAAGDPFVVGGARLASVRRWEISCEGNAHMGIATGPLAP